MGAVPSTPRWGSARPQDTAEYLVGTFVGEKSFPLASDYWQKLLELPFDLHWPQDRVHQACEALAQNNYYTRHLAKILIHLAWCLQECLSGVPSVALTKAINASYIASVFLKYLIESSYSDSVEELYLYLDDSEATPNNLSKEKRRRLEEGILQVLCDMSLILPFNNNELWAYNYCRDPSMLVNEVKALMKYDFSCQLQPHDIFLSPIYLAFMISIPSKLRSRFTLNMEKEYPMFQDQSIPNLVIHAVLSFIGKVDVSPNTHLLHQELLNFMLIAMSTQLLSGPKPSPNDVHPFICGAMVQESSLVSVVVRKLLLNYMMRPSFSNNATYPIVSDGNQPGVLQRVGSAAANIVLLPFNFFVGSSGEASRTTLADSSINILLTLIHYRKCVLVESVKTNSGSVTSESLLKEETYFSENPYCKALENARDVEFDRVDIEGNAHSSPLVRVPFASLFDTLGMCLTDEAAVLLLYALVHGNSDFLEYVLVRTDLDTLVMPLLETLYDAGQRTPNQIYMVLIILLILSQDSSFNASIHKLILPSVPWYQERRLHQTSLGSLMVIILIRTVKYNLSKLRDVYLHTNCLAILANMAPHVHRVSSYASQRLVSLFDMLSRKYTKLAELKNDKLHMSSGELNGDNLPDDTSAELYIYTDFLRIVLEIINAILSYALPRNPEVIYAIMHRQEVFQPFRNHPRFNELLENIFSVLDFFNSRMDAQKVDGEWSVEKVLQVIIINCRSWRGDGMKMFTQLHFTYEQESHPEEFFIPYVWKLVVSRSSLNFNPRSINLYPIDLPVEVSYPPEEVVGDEVVDSVV